MSKRSFLRKSAVSLAATLGLGGTAVLGQINIPPNQTGSVSGGVITFPGGPLGAQAINMSGGTLTFQIDPAGREGFSSLDGRFYDYTAGNPPEASFETVAAIEALAANPASVLVADTSLRTPIDFPATPAGAVPPFLSATDGQPFLSTGVVMTGAGDPDDSLFAIFEGKLNITTPELYQFFTASDDGSMMFIDLNRNGSFADPGERVVNNNLYQGTTKRGTDFPGDPALPQETAPTLTAGTYDVYVAMYEGGGGASVHATYTQSFFGEEKLIPLITDSASVTNAVNVTGDATINMAAGGLTLGLGPLTISDGKTLTKQGAGPLSFSQTTAGASSGINVASGDLTTGPILGPIGTFTKTGGGTLFATDTSKASGFTSTSTLSVEGGRFVAVAPSGSDAITPTPSSIGGAKILINGGTFVGRQSTYAANPGPGRVAVTFFNFAPDTPNLNPIDSGSGLLTMASTGKTLNWPLGLAFDDNNPDFGHPNFDSTSGGFVGVDNLAVLSYGRATFTSDPTHGNTYSFGTWSDDGVTLWIDLDNDGMFEPGDNGSGKNELVTPPGANSDHGPRIDIMQNVEIAPGNYRFAAGFYEKGGNAVMDFRIARGTATASTYDELKANFRQIGANDTTILTNYESLNPAPGSPILGVGLDFPNPVVVEGSGGLSGEGAVRYNNVTLQTDSELTVSGPIRIQNTIIDGSAKMNFQNQIDFGKLQPATAGADFTFIKTGPADLNLATTAVNALGSNATIAVGQGRMLAQGATATSPSSLGATTLGLAGGTFVAQGGTIAVDFAPGAANQLTEYFYNFTANAPETIINPIQGPNSLIGIRPTQTLTLTGPIGGAGSEYNDAFAQTRWGDQETLAAMWLGEMTFTTGASTGDLYSFWSNTDDGSTWWIDLDKNGKFEAMNGAGQNEMVLDNNVYQGPTQRRGLQRTGGSPTTTIPAGTYRTAFGAYEGGGGMLFEFKLGRGDIAYADAPFVNPTDSSIASYKSLTFFPVDDFSAKSFASTPVSVTANSTVDSVGSSKFGAMTFENTATVNFVGSGTQVASATASSGTGNIRNSVGPGRIHVGNVGAGAGATLAFSGFDSQVTGAFTGDGTVSLQEGTLEVTHAGAAGSGSPSLDIGGGTTMRFNPAGGGTVGAANVTGINNLGTLQADAGVTDLSGANVNTPAIVAGLLGGRVEGGRNLTDIPTVQGVDLRLTRAHSTDVGLFGGNGGTWVYRGEIKIPDTDGDGTPGPVAFGEQFDDNTLLKIDGQELINNNAWNIPGSSGQIERADNEPDGVGTAGDGWFTFEARFGDTGGGVGPNSGWTLGLGIDTDPSNGFDTASVGDPPVPPATASQYVEPFDNGTRNLFRAVPAPNMGQVTVASGATLKLGSVVGANAVNLAANSRLELHGATSKIQNTALSLPGTPTAPTATLDVTDSALVLDYATGANPSADVRSRIIAARGGTDLLGTWDGKGITSSNATAEPSTFSVGFANNADLPLGAYTEFRGQPVDDTSVLIRGTLIGDANLDGIVGDEDVTIVGATFGMTSGATWALGDFTYDGAVDDADVTLVSALYNPTAPPVGAPPALAGAVAAVPEPATWLMLALGGLGAGLFGWRRRKTQQ